MKNPAALLLLAPAASATRDWRMLDAYPPQMVAHKLAPTETIHIDGRLDDPAWQGVASAGMVDITRHTNTQYDAVPPDLQASVKVRWDDRYFYVGAELRSPFVTANNTGHNNHAPYSPDNDLEVFIDVSGTTQYYVEFEMSIQNATYDIKWGKPDGTKLACDHSGTGAGWPALPTCVNTSFPGYAGNWTMASKRHPGPTAGLHNTTPALMNGSATDPARGTTAWPAADDDTGLLSATAWEPAAYDRYSFPHSVWSAEIRFPIRSTPGYATSGGGYPASHGGLLDADPARQAEWDRFDPSLGDAGPGRPRYWWVNFARAVHPRRYTMPDGSFEVCPKNCTAALEHAANVSANLDGADALVHATWPTILGSYWEWVWGPVGTARPGVGYMHRPSSFPLVQFARAAGAPLCRNIEFPGRHVAKSLHLAQAAHASFHAGGFAPSLSALLNASLCNLEPTTSDTCDLDALRFAAANPQTFTVTIAVTEAAERLTRACPTRPCYLASVRVAVPARASAEEGKPAKPYAYTATINSNRDTVVRHEDPTAEAPCL